MKRSPIMSDALLVWRWDPFSPSTTSKSPTTFPRFHVSHLQNYLERALPVVLANINAGVEPVVSTFPLLMASKKAARATRRVVPANRFSILLLTISTPKRFFKASARSRVRGSLLPTGHSDIPPWCRCL